MKKKKKIFIKIDILKQRILLLEKNFKIMIKVNKIQIIHIIKEKILKMIPIKKLKKLMIILIK